MQKLYTSKQDEERIRQVLTALGPLFEAQESTGRDAKGQRVEPSPAQRFKLLALRMALGLSLQNSIPPALGSQTKEGGGEYSLEQVTGQGRAFKLDWTEALRAMVSVHHQEDLFSDPGQQDPESIDKRFVSLLYAHIQRGLIELEAALKQPMPLFEYLAQRLTPVEVSGAVLEELAARLRTLKIPTRILGSLQGGCGGSISLALLTPETLPRLEAALASISFEMGWPENSAFILPESRESISLQYALPMSEWQTYGLDTLEQWQRTRTTTTPAQVLMGMRGPGEPLTVGFEENNFVHVVTGDSQTGKTSLLQTLMFQWIQSQSTPVQVLVLVHEESSAWQRLRNPALNVDVYTAHRLNESGPQNLAGLSRILTPGPLETPDARLLVMDDVDALCETVPQLWPLLEARLKSTSPPIPMLMTIAPANASELLQILQASPRMAAPFLTVFRVGRAEHSQALLGHLGAERLCGPGDMLLRTREWVRRGQALMLTPEQISKRLLPLSKAKG